MSIRSALKSTLNVSAISVLGRAERAVMARLHLVQRAFTRTAARSEWLLRFAEACDRDGLVPWMVYPAIAYFEQLDLSGCRIFEYGSGSSSRYWARRCRSITSVEHDPEWYERGAQNTASNQTLLFHPEPADYVNAIGDGVFDIIVIDGEHRLDCAKRAIGNLSKRGMIVVDNSDWHPEICRLLGEHGLLQIDFIGCGPLITIAWATSIFLQPTFALPRKSSAPIVI